MSTKSRIASLKKLAAALAEFETSLDKTLNAGEESDDQFTSAELVEVQEIVSICHDIVLETADAADVPVEDLDDETLDNLFMVG